MLADLPSVAGISDRLPSAKLLICLLILEISLGRQAVNPRIDSVASLGTYERDW